MEIKNGFVYRFLLVLVTVCMPLVSCKDPNTKKAKDGVGNGLAHESSPYLLQHANNPVNWLPWGDRALEQAKAKNKLMVISIGYSTCHWCHVMEKESFKDEEVATVMNDHYISIKIDREERPDVDHWYMRAAQALTGSAGWPLNIIALPDARPVYAGTYHEKGEWIQVLNKFNEIYENEAAELENFATRVENGLEDQNLFGLDPSNKKAEFVNVEEAVEKWLPSWDRQWGGDKANEKFMFPVRLQFLLKYAVVNQDSEVLAFVKTTLDKMKDGGIYDHIGGGFFRYSVDPEWRVPHFEKMLYDNSQMLALYAKAYQVFKDEAYADVAKGTIGFLEEELLSENGGFYSALDADSEGEEGRHYLWTSKELEETLGPDFQLFEKAMNAESITLGEIEGYVVQPRKPDSELAQKVGLNREEFQKKKIGWINSLKKERGKREKPERDEKILNSWNAQLASAYVTAYMTFGNDEYLNKALGIKNMIDSKLIDGKKLHHHLFKGKLGEKVFLEDYAFYIRMCIDLFKATTEEKYLEKAKSVLSVANGFFYDAEKKIYRFNKEDEAFGAVIKIDDGVIASSNSVMVENLFDLSHIYFDKQLKEQAQDLLRNTRTLVADYPKFHAQWLSNTLNYTMDNYYEVAIVGDGAMGKLKEINSLYIPNALIAASTQESTVPLFEQRFVEGETLIYICQENLCKLPISDLTKAYEQLRP